MSYPVAKMLDGTYLEDREKGRGWSYGDAWTLTHYLTFSDQRRGQLRAYLNAINAGKKMAVAAQVFGDLGELQREVSVYLSGRSFSYRAVPIKEDSAGPITMRTLGAAESALIDMQIEFERHTFLPTKGDDEAQDVFDKRLAAAKQDRVAYLAKIEAVANHFPGEIDGWLLLADARCAIEEYSACTTAADRALAIAPDNERALVRKAQAMIGAAQDLPPAQRDPQVKAAQTMLNKANAADPNDPLALL